MHIHLTSPKIHQPTAFRFKQIPILSRSHSKIFAKQISQLDIYFSGKIFVFFCANTQMELDFIKQPQQHRQHYGECKKQQCWRSMQTVGRIFFSLLFLPKLINIICNPRILESVIFYKYQRKSESIGDIHKVHFPHIFVVLRHTN